MDTNQTDRPVTDLSSHVVQLARHIDRLPPGTYEITISKQDLRQQDWHFEIIRTERISSGDLSSSRPPTE